MSAGDRLKSNTYCSPHGLCHSPSGVLIAVSGSSGMYPHKCVIVLGMLRKYALCVLAAVLTGKELIETDAN
jgi:hypothetical protein